MRVVIYDDESLEAITVVNIPLTERDMLARGRIWRLTVPSGPPRIKFEPKPPTYEKMKVVEIEFEPFYRRTARHGEQRSYMAFTRAADLAMLVNPAWLPGQQTAIRYLEDQNDALCNMLMRVL